MGAAFSLLSPCSVKLTLFAGGTAAQTSPENQMRKRKRVDMIANEGIKIVFTGIELMENPGELYVLQKLKAAGIPIIGNFTFQGLKSGVLESYEDPCSDRLIFFWSNKKALESDDASA